MNKDNTINVTITFPIKKDRYIMYEYLIDDLCSGLQDIEVKAEDIFIQEE